VPDVAGDVLIVDDCADAREIVATLLESHGHRVRSASLGLEAIELAKSEPPDLVLLDVQLPDVDGFEVCRQLRTRWAPSEMPVLFVSATRDVHEKVRAFRLGGVDYVTKPFQFDEMLARVETHLELKRLQQQAANRTRELEALNARLRELEESRSSFLSAVVHDLKNPLTPVLKNTEWLMSQSHDEDGESGDVLRDLYLAANHMNRMVLSLLDVARGSDATLEPKGEAVRLAEWVDEAVSLTRLHLRGEPQRLTVEVQDATVCLDRALMTRVLQNLLDNALKYAPRQAEVRVHARASPDGGFEVVVEDDGPGIPQWARQRIFEPWARVERGDDPYARVSHGLGLAFCQKAVEAHGGHIRVEDAAPHGARFVVEVPPPWARRVHRDEPRKGAVAAAGTEE
jgi:two-component system, sensor histidine kinase and response regulator